MKQKQKVAKRGGDAQDLMAMAQQDLPTSKGNASGMYTTQKTIGSSGGFSSANYREYNPKEFQVEPGVFDFRKAPGYDEEIVRHNLNKVKRPKTAKIVAPALVKEVEIKETPNFILRNRNGLNEVSKLNEKRMQMMKEASTTQASKMTRATTAQSSRTDILHSPNDVHSTRKVARKRTS